MASAVLTTSRLPEEYHHSGGGNAAAGVETATSSSNHSSPTGSHDLSRNSPEHRPNSTDNHNPPPPYLQPDRREETSSSVDVIADTVPALLQPTADGVKTEALSYHGSLSGRSSADIPSVVESEAEPNRGASAAGGSNRDHGEMLLEKLEREFQTASAPRSLFGSGGGDNSSDRLGTPPGLQIVMPTDPDVSINSSSGLSENMLSPSGASGGLFNYHGDSLSPEHPRNFAITPVVENGREVFYCHLCSFCGDSREQLNGHLEGHFEHQCDKCDYTSRTEGRLKQHILRFHGNDDFNDDEAMDHMESHTSTSLGNPMLSSMEGYTTQPANQRTPGRQKVYRCKQCDFSATIKVEFWNHARTHIKEDKILQCPKCPFVTEYKHHLEYHLRNHFGSKPFKCNKCNYACVNKSMLNSHMKSHTNIYQYRCADCTYATKYCHSLKLHLRKYSHKPASILNLDGTIDHDTSSLLTMKRSGPKSSKLAKEEKERRDTDKPNQAHPPNVPQQGGLPRFPHPPPGMLPFWPLAGGMRPTPPPLIPVSMSNFFRGLMPPMLNPPMMPGQGHHPQPKLEPRSQTSPLNAEESKCKDSEFKPKSKEELLHHTKTHHLGAPPPFNMFGAENRNNSNGSPNNHNIWHGEMMGMNAAVAKAALAMPPFGPPNMQFGGYPKAPQHLPQNHQLSHSPVEKAYKPTTTSTSTPTSQPTSGEAPLDLTKANAPAADGFSAAESGGRKRSRKGKAYKLDALCLRLQEKIEPDDEDLDDMMEAELSPPMSNRRPESAESSFSKQEANVRPISNESSSSHNKLVSQETFGGKSADVKTNGHHVAPQRYSPIRLENNNNQQEEEKMNVDGQASQVENEGIPEKRLGIPHEKRKERYSCPYCDISFTDCIMYTMHMGYHGYQNPFKCNMCGAESNDKVSFFLHIARAPHA